MYKKFIYFILKDFASYAEAQAKERNKIDQTELNQALKNLDEYNKGLKKQKEDNKNRQKLYKEYLDNQTELDKLNKMKKQEMI